MGVGSDAEVADLVEAGAVLEQVATGFLFTEGPIWCDGGLLFSDMPSDKRRRWTPEGGVEVVRDPCNRCNGMTLDDDGGLIVCEHNTSVVVRERPDGTREIVASHYEGKELNSPNDVIVARDGSIVFTDPTYGRTVEAAGLLRPLELGFQGVYRIAPDGGLELLADDFEQPNGLCLSADEQLLYVNDTTRGHVRVFERGSDWQLRNGRVFAHVGGDGEVGQPDGMKLDERGNVYVTGPGGVVVFAPSGERIGLIEVPEVVGNLNWGDADYRTLYLAASSSIYRLRMAVAGNRVGYMA
ncbi:MAG TPA: SMP-30/gluconolactonase/LRE family protein [Conexibacter sp.]|nr:SMP-30/gluconolactonase/LRE family protein [Conexibacter sp.]